MALKPLIATGAPLPPLSQKNAVGRAGRSTVVLAASSTGAFSRRLGRAGTCGAVANRPALPRQKHRGLWLQYTSIDFTQTLTDHRVLQSIGSVGDAYDNAMAESFVDSFKTELITDRVWVSLQALEQRSSNTSAGSSLTACMEFLDDLPPAEFEALYAPQTKTTITL